MVILGFIPAVLLTGAAGAGAGAGARAVLLLPFLVAPKRAALFASRLMVLSSSPFLLSSQDLANLACPLSHRTDFTSTITHGKMKLLTVCLLVVSVLSTEAFVFRTALRTASAAVLKAKEGYTEDGYLIKPRDWFNGLSADPGDSLADSRAMPPVCKGTKILRANSKSLQATSLRNMTELITTPGVEAPITTLIFDIDDTLYDVGSGFTAHRNGDAVGQFMMARLHFADMADAMAVRNEYFAKYHSTAKALKIAEQEGRLPDGAVFHTHELSEWWAAHLTFSMLKPDPDLIDVLKACPLKIVAFTNAPRKYAIRVLETLQLRDVFPDERLFAVEDVLPHAKPDKEAFEKILEALGDGTVAANCVMVEDRMKNIRAAKALGMKTVLVSGITVGGVNAVATAASVATKAGDAPNSNDPAVDCSVATCRDIRAALPSLWQ